MREPEGVYNQNRQQTEKQRRQKALLYFNYLIKTLNDSLKEVEFGLVSGLNSVLYPQGRKGVFLSRLRSTKWLRDEANMCSALLLLHQGISSSAVFEVTERVWNGTQQAGASPEEKLGQRTVLRATVVEMLLWWRGLVIL